MLKITYKEYLKYEELYEKKEQNQVTCVKEESEEYIYDKKNEHDKVFRDVLSIKEEALALINKALKPKKEVKEEIELYNNRFITSKYRERESDIIYKVKNKNIFFIIEHQSTIDYSMVYRMMEYSIEIIRLIINGKENKSKTFKYPLIIPIIIYTGDKIWDAKLCMKELIEKVEWYEEKEDITLVDINNYTKEELIEEKNILSKVMLLEKSKNKIEFIKNIKKVLQTTENKNLEKMENIIRYKSLGIIEQDEIKKILKKIKIESEEETMTLAERINRNEREEKIRIRKEGIKEGINKGTKQSQRKAIINLIKLNVDETIISKAMEIEKKEIEEIKASMID